jgi:hypothetical protein
MAVGSNWTPADYDALVSLSAAQTPPISPVDAVFILFEEGGMNPASNAGSAFGMNGMDAENLQNLGITQSQWLAMTVQQQLAIIFKLWASWGKSDNNGNFPSDAGQLLALNFLPGAYKTISAGTNPDAVLAGKNGPYANYYSDNAPLQNSTGTITVNTLRQYVANTEAKSGAAWQNVVAQVQAAQARAGQNVASTAPATAPAANPWAQWTAIALGGVAFGMAAHYTVEQHGRQIAKAFRLPVRARENPIDEEFDLESFAFLVRSTAQQVGPEGRFGRFKVFVASIRDLAQEKDSWLGDMPELAYKYRLLQAHQKRLLVLSRADLVSGMDKDLVRRSQVDYYVGGRPVAEFHFVDLAK